MPAAAPTDFSIAALNTAGDSQAVDMMSAVVERSGWLAARIAAARPFADVAALAAQIEATMAQLSDADCLMLLRAHPELAPPAPGTMTRASQSEQARLQLLTPDPDLARQLAELNQRYIERHGYPFIIALHAHSDITTVLAQFESRLESDRVQERARALAEVVSVMKVRLARLTKGTGGSADGTAASIAPVQQPGEFQP